MSTAAHGPQCEVCDQPHLAVKMCPTCQEHMCEVAARLHANQKATRGHELVRVQTDPAQVAVGPENLKEHGQDNARPVHVVNRAESHTMCAQHNQPHGFFDVRCSRAVCRDCMVLEHQGHQCVPLQEGRIRMARKLEQIQAHADMALRATREDDAAQRTKLARMDYLFQQKEAELKLSFNRVSFFCLHESSCRIKKNSLEHLSLPILSVRTTTKNGKNGKNITQRVKKKDPHSKKHSFFCLGVLPNWNSSRCTQTSTA